MRSVQNSLHSMRHYHDPPIAQFLFSSPLTAPIWLIVCVYVGWQWLTAGIEKLTGIGWVNQGGSALATYWTRAIAVPKPPAKPAIAYGWYRDFINVLLVHHAAAWFAPLVTFGEILVGVALIVGAFTAIAAFFGTLMNFNYMLAGSASTNPVLFGLAVFIILGWKVAGLIGLDYWLLGLLGTPWERRMLYHKEQTADVTGRNQPIGSPVAH